MAAPTADEILELYDELNFPSAPKLRAALLKKGYRARMKDVEAFIKSQTPTQLVAKGPTHRGHIISSRANERWAIDFIDFTAEPDGNLKYILLAQDIHSRKSGRELWPRSGRLTISKRSEALCARPASQNNSTLMANLTSHNSSASFLQVLYLTASRRANKTWGYWMPLWEP